MREVAGRVVYLVTEEREDDPNESFEIRSTDPRLIP